MKRHGTFNWIIVGCVAMVVVAVSVLVYGSVISDKKSQSVDSGSVDANSSQLHETGKFGKAILDAQTQAEALVEIVNIDSTFRRTAALYDFLASTDNSDLIDMLRLSENIKRNSYRTGVQSIIVRKIASFEPNQALRWIADIPRVRRSPLLKSLFYDWSLINISEAVVGAQSLYGSDRHTALEAILSTRDDLSTPVLLKFARELGLEEFALHRISRAQTLDLLDDPGAAWDALVNDNIDDTKQLESLKLVAAAWTEQEGFDVFLRAARLFPNKNDRNALSNVIEVVASSKIEEAFAYLRKLPREERGELPCALAMVAARIDPVVALSEIAEWSDDPVHLYLQKTVATTWAHTDPRAMLDNLELLPQVARVDAMEIAFTHLAYTSPYEAIGYLEISKKFLRSEVLIAVIIAEQWSRADPDAALKWSISYTEAKSGIRKALIRRVLRNLVAIDVQKALELSRDLTSTRNHLTQAPYDVVWELVQMGKMDEAIALLPQLDEHPRYFAIENLGQVLVSVGAPYKALELGIAVPSLSAPIVGPASYFGGVFWDWSAHDPQQLFDSLPAITSLRLQSMAARTLLHFQESRPVLLEESVNSLKTLLEEHPTPRDLELLDLQMQDEKGLIDLDQLVLPKDWFE